MASEPQIDELERVTPSRAPQPVEGGTEYLGSLGRFIDDLMGDSRLHKRLRGESEGLFLSDDEMPEDPPLVEAPPPVPDGAGAFSDAAD